MSTKANGAISIPPGYVTREQAMQTLEKSDTSIERLVRTGELESKLFAVPGRRPIRYYTVKSVEAFRALEERKREVRPPSVVAKREKEKEQRIAERPPTALVSDATAATLREMIERLMAPKPITVIQKLWLSLDEAAELSGLARADLAKLCREAIGQLPASSHDTLLVRKSGGWKIQRKSLEEFAG